MYVAPKVIATFDAANLLGEAYGNCGNKGVGPGLGCVGNGSSHGNHLG